MRKLSLVMLLVLLVSLTAFAVHAQDEPEDDLDKLNLPLLADGEAVETAFEGTVTAHLYLFSGTQGDVVTITMVQAETAILDPFIILFGGRGEVLAYNDDSESPDDEPLSSAIVDFELPADGSYLVYATSLGEARSSSVTEDAPLEEPLEYELLMTGATPIEVPEGEDPFLLAGALYEVGDTNVLSVTVEEPVYYVFFSAEEGQTISITTEPAGSDNELTDTLLYLFDRDGNRLAAVDDTEDGLYAAVEFVAPYTGRYFAFATSAFYPFVVDDPENFTYIGDFTLTISAQ